MPRDEFAPAEIDLGQPEQDLGGAGSALTADVGYRSDFPRAALATVGMRGLANAYAVALADARCGIAPDTPSGAADGGLANRGSLLWWRHYIAVLDQVADQVVPGWREQSGDRSPYPWTEVAFGPVRRHGPVAPAVPRPDGQPADLPRVVGHWPSEMPLIPGDIALA